MTVLNCPIPKDIWAQGLGARNGTAVSALATRKGRATDDAGAWETCVQKIVQFQKLEDDWDGFGAKAPSHDLIESAVGLADLLHQRGTDPPQVVVPGVDGSVSFEWQDAAGLYAEIEIVRPYFAEVMVLEPGKEPQHWTLPTA
jgi:hypothetical protein